jgi:hypothetical protein
MSFYLFALFKDAPDSFIEGFLFHLPGERSQVAALGAR